MGDKFVDHAELEEIKKMLHDLDKRQTVLERDFQNFNTAFSTIISKLDTLPDKLTEQLGKTIRQEISTHKTECRLEILNKDEEGGGDEKEKGFLQWIIKNQLQIMFVAVLILAAYFGVKMP
jgi:hypothetical protein